MSRTQHGRTGVTAGSEKQFGGISRGRPWKLISAAIAVLVIVAAGGGWLIFHSPKPAPPAQPCASCVSFPSITAAIERDMTAAQRKDAKAILTDIEHKNARVRLDTGRPWVSVMLLTPLTTAAGSDVTAQRMLDVLRGAYDAQLSMDGSAGTVGVQLLLDNEGTSTEGTEGPAVRQLEFMEKADRIVATAGMGLSNAATAAAAATLNGNGMPMFGAVTTADQFSGPGYPDMVQVVPDVTAQVTQLAKELGRLQGAVLVYDSSATDYYTGDLTTDFKRLFASSLRGQPQPYTPTADPSTQFRITAQEVCYQQGPPPVILYAGRQSVLSAFIAELQAYGNCKDEPITVVTGSDGDGLPLASTVSQPGEGKVSVVYADIVDLAALSKSFTTDYTSSLAQADPGATGLGDTWLAATYNAMVAADTAIQQAYTGPAAGVSISAASVLVWVDRLNEALQVTGAAGQFSLSNNGKLIDAQISVEEDTNGQRVPFSPAAAARLRQS